MRGTPLTPYFRGLFLLTLLLLPSETCFGLEWQPAPKSPHFRDYSLLAGPDSPGDAGIDLFSFSSSYSVNPLPFRTARGFEFSPAKDLYDLTLSYSKSFPDNLRLGALIPVERLGSSQSSTSVIGLGGVVIELKKDYGKWAFLLTLEAPGAFGGSFQVQNPETGQSTRTPLDSPFGRFGAHAARNFSLSSNLDICAGFGVVFSPEDVSLGIDRSKEIRLTAAGVYSFSPEFGVELGFQKKSRPNDSPLLPQAAIRLTSPSGTSFTLGVGSVDFGSSSPQSFQLAVGLSFRLGSRPFADNLVRAPRTEITYPSRFTEIKGGSTGAAPSATTNHGVFHELGPSDQGAEKNVPDSSIRIREPVPRDSELLNRSFPEANPGYRFD